MAEINGKSGTYLAQVKQNQANLLKECIRLNQYIPAIKTHENNYCTTNFRAKGLKFDPAKSLCRLQ